eukprot:1147146-Pelagomonas_calceolata.AAC.11
MAPFVLDFFKGTPDHQKLPNLVQWVVGYGELVLKLGLTLRQIRHVRPNLPVSTLVLQRPETRAARGTQSQISQAMCENEELMPRCKLRMQSG